MNKYEKAANALMEHVPQCAGASMQTTNYVAAMENAVRLLFQASGMMQKIEAACDPNNTKALLIGEFETESDLDGPPVTVDWTTTKEIQRAVLENIKLALGWKCEGCGSREHILSIRDKGGRWCCPERRLIE